MEVKQMTFKKLKELDELYGEWNHIDNGCILSWLDSEYGAIFFSNRPDEIEAWNRRAE